MTQYAEITGVLECFGELTGAVECSGQLDGMISLPDLTPPIFPIYDGEYTVTPHFYEQTIETKDKLMTDDVTVEIIPAHEVTNSAGGLTVTIG